MVNELNPSKHPSAAKDLSVEGGTEDVLVTETKSLLKRKPGKNKDTPQEENEIRTRVIKLLSSPEYESQLSAVFDEADVPRLAYFVRASWKDLSDEAKEKLIDGAFSRTSDKAIVRQTAIARELARLDSGRPSVRILHNLLGGAKKSDLQRGKISKAKRDAIEIYFFKKPSDWIDMPADDRALILPVLRAFVEITAQPGLYEHLQNKKVLLDFGAWAIAVASRLALEAPAGTEITTHLKSMIQFIPDDLRADLSKKVADLARQVGTPISPLTQSPNLQEEQPDQTAPSLKGQPEIEVEQTVPATNQPLTRDETSSPSPSPVVQRAPSVASSAAAAEASRVVATALDRSAVTEAGQRTDMTDGEAIQLAEAWIQEREEEIARQQSEVKLMRKIREMLLTELSQRKELEEQLLQTRRTKERAVEQETELRQSLTALKTRVDQLENHNLELRKECASNRGLSKELESRTASLKSSLEEKEHELRAEHESFNARLDREINRSLKTHIADIGRKLHPIFKNKKLADGEEPTADHAKFLQDCFQQLEEALENLGVKLSGEF